MVKRFEESDHLEICRWYESYNMPAIPMENLPKFGLCVPGLACGFLIETDAKIGIIDFYIANPEADKSEKSKALDAITGGLIRHGIKIGLKYFKADTQLDVVRDRCKKHHFEYVGEFSTYFLTLRED